MTKEEVAERVRQSIADEVGMNISEITDDKRILEDLDVDSLDTIEIVIELEDEFEFGEIPDYDAARWTTVGDVVEYIWGRVSEDSTK